MQACSVGLIDSDALLFVDPALRHELPNVSCLPVGAGSSVCVSKGIRPAFQGGGFSRVRAIIPTATVAQTQHFQQFVPMPEDSTRKLSYCSVD
jgi:hypothetical protein